MGWHTVSIQLYPQTIHILFGLGMELGTLTSFVYDDNDDDDNDDATNYNDDSVVYDIYNEYGPSYAYEAIFLLFLT